MKILIDEVLVERGKKRNWLANETGMTYTNICNLCNGKTDSVKFEKLDRICSVLNCEISDIMQAEKFEMNRLIVYQEKIRRLHNNGDTK